MKLIEQQIREYCEWRSSKSPWIAGARFNLLTRFTKQFRLETVSDIREEHVAFYTGEQLTEFYSEEALRAIRNFLWYCRQAGYQCIASQMATKENLQKIMGRPIQWDMVREVKKTYNTKKGRGYRTTASIISARLSRPVHVSSVRRWVSLIPRLP